MKKLLLLLTSAILLSLGGCGLAPTVPEAPAVTDISEQKEDQPETVEEPEVLVLSARECYNIVRNALGAVDVLIMQGESGLVVDDARYYVYIVAQMDGKALGQIAINENDGALYYYEGEGKLSDYSKMTDRLREMDAEEATQTVPMWSGSYADGVHSLEIEYEAGEALFSFVLDGQSGKAVVIDHQAVSVDNDVKFIYEEDGNITATGKVDAVFVFGAQVETLVGDPKAPAVDAETPTEAPTVEPEAPAEGETDLPEAPTEGEQPEVPAEQAPTEDVPTDLPITQEEPIA